MSAINITDHIVSQPAFTISLAASSAQSAINSVANIARIALDTITFCQFPALYTNNYKSRTLLSSLAFIPMRLLNDNAYTVEPSDLKERFYRKVQSNFLHKEHVNSWVNSGRHLVRAPVILIAAIADVAAGALGFIAATCTLYQIDSINKFTFVHLEGIAGIESALLSLRNAVSTNNANQRQCDGILGFAQKHVGNLLNLPSAIVENLGKRAVNVIHTVNSCFYKVISIATFEKLETVNRYAGAVDVYTAVTSLFERVK